MPLLSVIYKFFAGTSLELDSEVSFWDGLTDYVADHLRCFPVAQARVVATVPWPGS
jgi:hypothetical protein